MSKNEAIEAIKAAGARDDRHALVMIMLENSVSADDALAAFSEGKRRFPYANGASITADHDWVIDRPAA